MFNLVLVPLPRMVIRVGHVGRACEGGSRNNSPTGGVWGAIQKDGG